MNNARVNLGDRARDVVTGAEGIVVGASQFLAGCHQFGLQKLKADGSDTTTLWFDESRLEVVEAQAVKLIVNTPKPEPERPITKDAQPRASVAAPGGPQAVPPISNRR